MLQVPEGEEPPPPAPEPVVEEDEDEGEDAEKEREVWNAYTTVKGLSVSVSGLKEGKRYKFRVAAKNIIGCSSFTETREASEIKEQIRESPRSAFSSFNMFFYFSSFNMVDFYSLFNMLYFHCLFNMLYFYSSFNPMCFYSGAQDHHG